MSSKVPIIKQMAWVSVIPHLIVMGGLVMIWRLLALGDNFVFYGLVNYLLLSFCLRTFVAKSHSLGMKAIKENDFEKAIENFEVSYHFFSNYNWLDRFRYLVMLSSSKLSYKEMALCNIAYSYFQLGDKNRGKYYYEKTLDEFPDNFLAKSALNMIETIERE